LAYLFVCKEVTVEQKLLYIPYQHGIGMLRQQFQSGLKTHLFKRAYIWLIPARTIEEWTYLLTYLCGCTSAGL